MPAHFTHYAVARETLKDFPPDLRQTLLPHLSLYFFGAQGPDFCFFYKLLPPKRNFGSFLHQEGSFTAFEVLKALSITPAQLAYALGYITHYAADVLFHPVVYALCGNSLVKHTRLENNLDLFFKSNDRHDPFLPFFKRILTTEEKSELFLTYASITAKCDLPPLEKRRFLQAISLFNAYLPIPNALQTTFLRKNSQLKKEEVIDLFFRSVTLSCTLCQSFLSSIENHTPLPRKEFGKSYLTGKLSE